jgi:hypothetical protein
MLVTVWNLAIAGGGILGGIVLERVGTQGFTPLLLLLAVAMWMAWSAGKNAEVCAQQRSRNGNATSRSAHSVLCCAHCE